MTRMTKAEERHHAELRAYGGMTREERVEINAYLWARQFGPGVVKAVQEAMANGERGCNTCSWDKDRHSVHLSLSVTAYPDVGPDEGEDRSLATDTTLDLCPFHIGPQGAVHTAQWYMTGRDCRRVSPVYEQDVSHYRGEPDELSDITYMRTIKPPTSTER